MRYVAVLLLFSLFSCFISKTVIFKRFSFYEGDKPRHISLRVPRGFESEKIKVGNYGKEQFYVYRDSAMFYIGLNVDWATINQERGFVNKPDSLHPRNGIHNGVDAKGRFWKEVHVDYFLIGYSHVPPEKLEEFEKAVQSIRFK